MFDTAFVCLDDYRLSLECVNECELRNDSTRIIGESLPTSLTIKPSQFISTATVGGKQQFLVVAS